MSTALLILWSHAWYQWNMVLPTVHTTWLRRWINVSDVDSTSQSRRVPSGYLSVSPGLGELSIGWRIAITSCPALLLILFLVADGIHIVTDSNLRPPWARMMLCCCWLHLNLNLNRAIDQQRQSCQDLLLQTPRYDFLIPSWQYIADFVKRFGSCLIVRPHRSSNPSLSSYIGLSSVIFPLCVTSPGVLLPHLAHILLWCVRSCRTRRRSYTRGTMLVHRLRG